MSTFPPTTPKPKPPPVRAVAGLVIAERTRPRPLPPASSPAAKLGLQFERRVFRELAQLQLAGRIAKLEHNPWFAFADTNGPGLCCPDFLAQTDFGLTIIEVKLTWVEEAERKLRLLYLPVVARLFGKIPSTLVLCRRLADGAPAADVALSSALAKPSALLLWPSNGRIPW